MIISANFLCLSSPSATFALQHGGFVLREWLGAKGLCLWKGQLSKKNYFLHFKFTMKFKEVRFKLGGWTPHMKWMGMLVGNFELNP